MAANLSMPFLISRRRIFSYTNSRLSSLSSRTPTPYAPASPPRFPLTSSELSYLTRSFSASHTSANSSQAATDPRYSIASHITSPPATINGQPILSHIDHVVLTVADIDASVEFYTKVLGMQKEVFGTGDKKRIALKFGNQKVRSLQSSPWYTRSRPRLILSRLFPKTADQSTARRCQNHAARIPSHDGQCRPLLHLTSPHCGD